MKKLPVGLPTFSDLIKKDYLYIDKTKEIYKLLESGEKYFFISRPRRFGKSLLVSTLEELFTGNKELFKGLWIYDKIKWQEYPVIAIDFTQVSYKTPEVLEGSLKRLLDEKAELNGIKISREKDYKESFLELIKKLSPKGRVVLLVDEYDKPIIDKIEEKEIAFQNRDVLKEFYSVIKSSDQYIEFAFLTGVSKFSKVSVFSGLNNLNDITLDDRYATLLGYTEDELLHYFENRINDIVSSGLEAVPKSKEELLNQIRRWYNGYSWDGRNFVYNPLSILKLFSKKEFDNYWFTTGTPTFLIKTLREKEINVGNFENLEVDSSVFDSYDIDNMESTSLLFQTGYLTVKQKVVTEDGILYYLTYPNKEVRESFLKHLLKSFTEKEFFENLKILRKLKESLKRSNIDAFINVLKSLFASIPYDIIVHNREAYYNTVIYLVLKLIGADIRPEEETNIGRIDGVLETSQKIYIMEFKIGSEDEALEQIKEKKYYQPYQSGDKAIVLLGIGFDMEERNIRGYLTEDLS